MQRNFSFQCIIMHFYKIYWDLYIKVQKMWYMHMAESHLGFIYRLLVLL